MAWRWVYGGGTSGEFESREQAEDWLRGSWESLAEEGVPSVTLMDGDEVAYEMSLAPE